MRNPSLIALTLLALAACGPQIPDSGASAAAPTPAAEAPRDATRTAAAVLGVADPGAPAATRAPAPTPGAAPLSAMGADAVTGVIAAAPAAPAAPAEISDEQNFAAVAARESIASDAERIDQNRAQYVVIEPTQLPPRPDGTGASIVAYALATTNAPGQALYRRSGIAIQARFERNCAKYASPDLAQEAFLDAGGPKRDRYSLDPDGDGFACYWDPRPFRAAQAGAPAVVEQYEVIETPGDS